MIGETLLVFGFIIFCIAAFLIWVKILGECFILEDYLEGIFFLGIGLIVIGLIFSKILII